MHQLDEVATQCVGVLGSSAQLSCSTHIVPAASHPSLSTGRRDAAILEHAAGCETGNPFVGARLCLDRSFTNTAFAALPFMPWVRPQQHHTIELAPAHSRHLAGARTACYPATLLPWE